MGITKKKSNITVLFPFLFCLSFILGQFGRIDMSGITVYLHELVLIFGLVLFSPQIMRLKLPIRNIFLPAIFFSFGVIISLLFSMHGTSDREIFLSIGYLVRFVLYSGLVFLIPLTGGVRAWVKSMSIAGLMFAVLGFIQFILYPDLRNIMYLGWDPHYMRFVSTLFDPNIAGFMLISFLLITFLAFQGEKKLRKIYGMMMGVEILAIILTFSRSTIVTLGLVLAVYAIINKIWWPVIAAVGVGLLSVVTIPFGSFMSPMRIVSALARVDNFNRGVQMFLSSPLTGVGWYMANLSPHADVVTRAYAGIDNSFLFVLATTGIIGFTAFLWFLSQIAQFIKKESRVVSTRTSGIIVGLILLTLIIHSQFENIFFSAWGLTWLWICVGFLLSLQQKK